ncbi:hypothetical protein NG799_26940 [Laspinema sp. D1]|uniref:Uncharacterized protein n=1 Tax=Laspinema palackyanum D2a TaxID=2953684 RepID=A0ABT2MYW4_9CYAN|nr:hypothetical protein [Laspinema sp. D2b]MCT7969954.1 hypothetical protein [Laspinema sp. D2a]
MAPVQGAIAIKPDGRRSSPDKKPYLIKVLSGRSVVFVPTRELISTMSVNGSIRQRRANRTVCPIFHI